MKKRLVSLLAVFAMLFGIMPTMSLAATVVASGKCGDNLEWSYDGAGTLTISGSGAMWDYNGYEVMSDAPWRSCSYTKVIIEDGVTSIGDCAFYLGVDDNYGLSRVEIPNSVKRIGKFSFYHCRQLKSINLPYEIQQIDDYAFYCSGLTEIYIPASVEEIGIGVFAGNCSYGIIENIGNINVDVKNKKYCSVNGSLFNKEQTELIAYGENGCSYTIPNNVNTIGAYAFAGCQSITNVTIPNSVSVIEDCAFKGCQSITDITIPDGVNTIGAYAFEGCKSITNIMMSDSVNTMGAYVFMFCDSLTDIYFLGSKSQWEQIENIDKTDFTNITIHYNSAMPVEDESPFTVTYSGSTATVTNTSDTAQTADIVLASYTNSGVLDKITSRTRLTLYGGKSQTYTLPPNGKIFAWDSLQGMKPLNK